MNGLKLYSMIYLAIIVLYTLFVSFKKITDKDFWTYVAVIFSLMPIWWYVVLSRV